MTGFRARLDPMTCMILEIGSLRRTGANCASGKGLICQPAVQAPARPWIMDRIQLTRLIGEVHCFNLPGKIAVNEVLDSEFLLFFIQHDQRTKFISANMFRMGFSVK